jgi:hypothetical protein
MSDTPEPAPDRWPSLAVLPELVQEMAAICREAKRPDAAQALEDRTEEEWLKCFSSSWRRRPALINRANLLTISFAWSQQAASTTQRRKLCSRKSC